MNTTSTRCLFLCLSGVLLLGMLMTGCASTTSGGGALDPASVRTDIAVWEELGWADMTAAEQELWGAMGWSEASWEEEEKAPASEDKYWKQLTPEEQAAATSLGYTKANWDGE